MVSGQWSPDLVWAVLFVWRRLRIGEDCALDPPQESQPSSPAHFSFPLGGLGGKRAPSTEPRVPAQAADTAVLSLSPASALSEYSSRILKILRRCTPF